MRCAAFLYDSTLYAVHSYYRCKYGLTKSIFGGQLCMELIMTSPVDVYFDAR
jgi:hypothetical protein